MIQTTRHRRLCMMIWGSNYWIIVLKDSILVFLLVSLTSRPLVAKLILRWPDWQVSSSTGIAELS
jgi:hypothetical protein